MRMQRLVVYSCVVFSVVEFSEGGQCTVHSCHCHMFAMLFLSVILRLLILALDPCLCRRLDVSFL